MKEGKQAEQYVVPLQLDDFVDGLDIRADVLERKHDAFGLAGRAGRENDGQQIVRLDLRQAEESLQDGDRRGVRLNGGDGLVDSGHFLAQVLQVDHLRVQFKLELLHHAAA